MTSIPSHPSLAEALRSGDGEDRIGVIGRLRDPEKLPEGVDVITRFGDIATLRLKRRQLTDLSESGACRDIEASRRVSAPLDAPLAEKRQQSPASSLRRPAGLTETGKGVVIGVIDWGIDVRHKAFLDARNQSRIKMLWDQRGPSHEQNRWGYGRIHTRDDINAALASGDPYEALGYKPWHSDASNSGSHGTHVASIAAGSPYPDGESGVAPDADIVFVHLARTPNVLEEGNLGDSLSVLEALDFIYTAAGDQPVVINLSVGAHSGNHTGRSLVERGIDQSVWLTPGRAVVNSAGNYRKKAAHASGRLVKAQTETLPFVIPDDDLNDSEIEVFYSDMDRLDVLLRSPSNRVFGPVSISEDLSIEIDGKKVGHLYHQHDRNHSDHHIDLFLYKNAPPGQWAIELHAERVNDGRFHAWIERDSSQQPFFKGPLVDTRTTIGTLANGKFSITVGAYDSNHEHRPLGEFSSVGPTRRGAIKPELIAPGVGIRAARSASDATPEMTRSTIKSGTSMAAPYVAGSLALMFEAMRRKLDITETRALLFSELDEAPRCRHQACNKHDLHAIGYGYLNLKRLINAIKHRETLMDDVIDVESTTDVLASEAVPEIFESDEHADHCADDTSSQSLANTALIDSSEPFADLLDIDSERTDIGNASVLGGNSIPLCETGCQRLPRVGDLLMRRSDAEGVDYRGVLVSDLQQRIDPNADDAVVESRGEGWYARVLEQGVGSDLAKFAIRKILNVDGATLRGQRILPLAGPDADEVDEMSDAAIFQEALPGLSDWQHLISFRPPVSVQRSLVRRRAPDWSVHRIEDARGDINLDYYPIRVVRMPTVGGRTLTAEALLQMLRLDINAFIDTRISSFRPYNRSSAIRWRSSSPVGSVIHIDMKTAGGYLNPDDGSVVCSHASSQDWIFSTIWTPADFGHPVSGNRQFGFEQRNGEWIFFTRGADRTTGRMDSLMSGTVFSKADELWRSLQRGVADFVNRNGGAAVYLSRTSRRYNWPAVRSAYWRPSVRWI